MTKSINRREFLKRMSLGSAAVATGIAAQSCVGKIVDSPLSGDTDPSGAAFNEGQLNGMTYRTNPNTGDKVSLLGYGMMRLPQLPGGQAAANGNDLDQEQVNRLVDYAIRHGVNYFDTSPVYCKGFSEQATGIALARHPRESYYIATKLSNFNASLQTFEASRKMFLDSLKNLQTTYIDYLLLHSVGGGGMPNFNQRFIDNGVLDWLVEQKQVGTIRNLGFSFHGEVEVFDTLLSWHDEGRYHWDFVQIQMNYVDWKHASEQNNRNIDAEYLYGELSRRGIPAVIMEPLLGGRLSKLPNHVISHLKQRLPQNSAASWAFRFCGTYPDVLTVLSGMTYMEHLQDNLRTYSPLEMLSQEDLDYLEQTAQMILKYPLIPCNDCKYCMPCPYGIDIPAVLLHYNKMVNEGRVPSSQEDPTYHRLRKEYLLTYNEAVSQLRQADHCIGCNQCSPHCPQNIRIPQQLHRIDDFVESLKRSGD